MTEEDWLTHSEPATLLAYLRGKTSERKLRLFAAGCCRKSWDIIPPTRSRYAVQVAEFHADHLAREDELLEAWRKAAAFALRVDPAERDGAYAAAFTAFNGFEDDTFSVGPMWERFQHATLIDWVREVSRFLVERPFDPESQHSSRALRVAERFDQCDLLRDIFGNPFQPLPFDPHWLTANVTDLSRTIYDERAFERLPILSDALMDAGCAEETVLAHCRSELPHARGCWLIDRILGMG